VGSQISLWMFNEEDEEQGEEGREGEGHDLACSLIIIY